VACQAISTYPQADGLFAVKWQLAMVFSQQYNRKLFTYITVIQVYAYKPGEAQKKSKNIILDTLEFLCNDCN
jgi:hypothetical protein